MVCHKFVVSDQVGTAFYSLYTESLLITTTATAVTTSAITTTAANIIIITTTLTPLSVASVV